MQVLRLRLAQNARQTSLKMTGCFLIGAFWGDGRIDGAAARRWLVLAAPFGSAQGRLGVTQHLC